MRRIPPIRTLADALRIVQAQTALPYLGMHQRWTRKRRGCCCSAGREANRALAAAFEGRDVRKVYLALAWGTPPQDEGVIDAPIVRDHGERYRVTTPGDPRGLARGRDIGCWIPFTGAVSLRQPMKTRRRHDAKAQSRTDALPCWSSSPRDRPAAPDSRPPGAHRLPGGRRSALRARGPAVPRLCLHASTHPAAPGDGRSHHIHRAAAAVVRPHQETSSRTARSETGQSRKLFFDRALAPPPLPLPARRGVHLLLPDSGAHHIRNAMRSPDTVRALLHLAVERRAPLAADPRRPLSAGQRRGRWPAGPDRRPLRRCAGCGYL